MSNEEAYALIGERAGEIARTPEAREKMMRIATERGTDEAVSWVYKAAIATLCGCR